MFRLHLFFALLPSTLAFTIPKLPSLDVSSLHLTNIDLSEPVADIKSIVSSATVNPVANSISTPSPTVPTSAPPLKDGNSEALPCNGHAELCGREYSNVTHLGTHDSPFVGPLLTDNQNLDITSQLNFGVRFLQGQTHVNEDTLNLCHTSCLLRNAGPLTDFLKTVSEFLDNNPREIVTLLLTNGDNAAVIKFDDAFTSSGARKHVFTPSSSSQGKPLALDEWLTLGQLIERNTRLVVFLDSGADTSGKAAPYILDEFTYFFETPFDTTDPSFNQCRLDRPANSSPDAKMYIVNHFLYKKIWIGKEVLVPAWEKAEETNARNGDGSIGQQIIRCEGIYQKAPWGVLVDFVDQGDVVAAQNDANGL